MNNSYIKLYRKITEWEWYKDAATSRLFFHLLIIASRFSRRERGVEIMPGQVLVTERELAESLGYTWPNHRQTIRTAITHLKLTNEITTEVTKGGTLITVVNYKNYQGVEYEANHAANQTDNQQLTIGQPSANHPLTNLPIIRERKKERREELQEGGGVSQKLEELRKQRDAITAKWAGGKTK